MKKLLLLLALPVLLVLSCSDNKSGSRLFNVQNLRTQYFSINPTIDTTLFGLRGGIFSIEKGSFEGESSIDIEIKEAYSPSEIVYAGLTTESDGRLLESGGMVYFNAKRNGKQAKLLKPVDISIPTHYVNDEMKLFKGEENSDGSVNWKDPEPLDSSINISPIDTAERLFMGKCASCHSIFKDGTGPALAGVEERLNDRTILRSFIQDPGAVMAENLYFQCQKLKFGSMMTGFPDLTDKDIDLILDYIKNETAKRPDLKPVLDMPEKKLHSLDTTDYSSCIPAPCGFDTIYVDTTEYGYVSGNMMNLNEEATKNDSMDYLYKNPDSLEKAMRKNGFADIVSTEGRYNFRIRTLGWFNVDAFYEGLKGTEIVDLFVKTDFEQQKNVGIHVFFPDKKTLTVGKFHEEDGLFHFEKYKGQIPLFINENAIVLGYASIGEKIYYGITTFKVSKQQTISLAIKETTKQELTGAFKKMNLDGIDLDVITKKRIIVPKDCPDATITNVEFTN